MIRLLSKLAILGLILAQGLIIAADDFAPPYPENKPFKDSWRKAKQQCQSGLLNEAMASFSGLLLEARIENNEKGEAECLMALGTLFWDSGDLVKSADYYAKALKIAGEKEWGSLRIFCETALAVYDLYRSGKSYRENAQFALSEASFLKAIELSRRIKSANHEAKCLRQLSINDYYESRLEKFFLLNKRAYEISGQNNLFREKANSAFNMAFYHLKSGRFYDAYLAFQEAGEIYHRLGLPDDETECFHNVALIYYEMGSYECALRRLSRCLAETRNAELRTAILNSMGNARKKLALIDNDRSGLAEAVSYYRQALDLAIEGKNRFFQTVILNNLGYHYFKMNQVPLALRYFELSQEASRDIPDRELKGTVRANLGNAYFSLGEYGLAEKSYLSARRCLDDERYAGILWEVFFGLGQCHQHGGKPDEALSCYLRSVRMIEATADKIGGEYERANFLHDKFDVSEAAIGLLVGECDFDSLGQSTLAKIVAVIESARAGKKAEAPAGPGFSAPQGNRTGKRYGWLLGKLSEMIHVAEYGPESLLDPEDEFFHSLKSSGEERLKTSDSSLADDEWSPSIPDEKTAIVMYFISDSISLAIIMRGDKVEGYRLPAKGRLEKDIAGYLKLMSSAPQSEFQEKRAAQRLLGEIFVPDHEKKLKDIRNIVVIPDGILCYLPFESLALNTPSGEGPIYMVQKYNISYAPSLSALLSSPGQTVKSSKAKSVLVMGKSDYHEYSSSTDDEYLASMRQAYSQLGAAFSSLTGVAREVKNIGGVVGRGKSDILLDQSAAEEYLKNNSLFQYRILHFACHGLIDENLPMRSALVLTRKRTSGEDGFLHVNEIKSLKLNAELVVLSSCQTGKGRLGRGTGAMSLAKAFIYAGARSVLSTL
ncbi:MAG: hypothetical protein A2Y86_08895, partial [Candidatus Aminicenantes bacterium RBG_13_62_12]